LDAANDTHKQRFIAIQFTPDLMQKTGPRRILDVEMAKTLAAARIGDASNVFTVPKIVRHDADIGIIEFERIPRLLTLYQLARRGDARLPDLLARAGEALALIHTHLRLPSALKISLPSAWMLPEAENAFLHGDFTPSNVGLDESTGQLVIFDWSAVPFIAPLATFGPRYFDLVWFAVNLFNTRPWPSLTRWTVRKMADVFIRAYLAAQNERLERDVFREYRRRMLQSYNMGFKIGIKKCPWHKRLGHQLIRAAATWMWNRYEPSA